MLKKIFKMKFLSIFLIMLFVCIQVPFANIRELPDEILITSNEIEQINNGSIFGKWISCDLSQTAVTADSTYCSPSKQELIVKLLNVIPIKKINVNVKSNSVLVGGNAIGMSLQNDGIIIIGFNYVTTSKGLVKPYDNSGLKIGDRIKYINDIEINSVADLDAVLNSGSYNGEIVQVVYYRNNKEYTTIMRPAYDNVSKGYKLGLWIREDTCGIGTLTFINPKTNRFGALGHGICEESSSELINISGGNIYSCDIVGVNKGQRGKTGELKGCFTASGENCEGAIDKNTNYGLFGTVSSDSEYLKNKSIEIGGRLSAKPGKAYILSCIDGKTIEQFEVEIIKTNYQNKSSDKSMVLRVTDKDLLNRSGGIVQGMSGSPIIQDGKLIGAVTHVFVNDPTKGFGIYLDWMLDK